MVNKNIPTAHNACADASMIAETVLMPGDPLRAKFIAETFLTDVIQFTSVRNVLGFTGKYRSKRISVMASGMGQASMGIYCYELYNFYGVKNIIRIGSAGGYTKDLKIYDVVLVNKSYSDSHYAKTFCSSDETVVYPSKELNDKILAASAASGIEIKEVTVYSSDCFYHLNNDFFEEVQKQGCTAVEMESFALFTTANALHKNAACILTISDSYVYPEEASSEERERKFTQMIDLALSIEGI